MLTIDLSQFNTYFTIALPVLAAFIAGIIRQDKLPGPANELISLVVVLLIALVQALLGGKLGGSPLADFGIITAYSLALLHTPLGQSFQQGVQSNVLSFGKPAPKPEPILPLPANTQINIDSAAVANMLVQRLDINRLAQLLIAELGKPNVPAPQVTPPVLPIESQPTQTQLQAIRTSTPPVQGG